MSGQPHPEPGRAELGHLQLVTDAAQLELDRSAELVPRLRPAAVRGGQEVLPLGVLRDLIGLNGCCHQGNAGMPVRDQAALGPNPIDPTGVGAGVDDARFDPAIPE